MENIKIPKPYYKSSANFNDQIKSGSERREMSKLKFLFIKSRNLIFARLAYNCPINSLRVKFHKLRGVHIGDNVMIGLHVIIDHSYPELIYIGDDVSLAGNNYILAHSNPYPHFSKIFESFAAPVCIQKGAWLAIGSMVLPNVTIGEYAVITASSVVNKSIPSRSIAGGNPAKVLHDIARIL